MLPRFGVECLTALVSESGIDGPVFANRDGGWMSLTNMRRSLRAALPDDMDWVTPQLPAHRSNGRAGRPRASAGSAATVAFEVGDNRGALLQRHTRGPDVRHALDEYAAGQSGN
jgi:hypothetical protein